LRAGGVAPRPPAARDSTGLVAAGSQRSLGRADAGRARRQAIAREAPLHADLDVAVAVGQVRRLVDTVDQLGHDALGALVADAPDLGGERAVLGHHVDGGPSRDRADVDRRLLI